MTDERPEVEQGDVQDAFVELTDILKGLRSLATIAGRSPLGELGLDEFIAAVQPEVDEIRQWLLETWDAEDEDLISYCAGCGECVQSYDAPSEWYSVTRDVWDIVAPDDPHDMTLFLCIGCVEERLGRRLTSYDFSDVPLNAMALVGGSDRLIDRLTTPELSPAMHRSIAALDKHLTPGP